jgi:hypothetical protein
MSDLDNLHGSPVVAKLVIELHRDGSMSVAGSLTDEVYDLFLLDTARDTIKAYHAQRRAGLRGQLVVPAYDTALVGTPEERKLIQARDQLDNAYVAGG